MRPSEKNGSPQTHLIPDYRNPKCPILPLLTAVYFHFFPAVPGSSSFLINGIILACECAFLFKYVLFALVTHHLKGEFAYRRQTALLFLPLILLVIYIFYYFGAF